MKPVSGFVLVIAVLIALTVVYYVRRWRLKEQYSLLWLVLAVGMVVFTAAPGLMEWFAGKLNVFYPPGILFFLALALVAVMLFHYSLEISRLSDQNRELAQQLGLLRAWLEEVGVPLYPDQDAPPERSATADG